MMLPLTTPRLLLRRFRTEDLPSFSHYRNLPEVARFQSWTHYGMTEATAFYEQQRSLAFAEDESWFQLAVEIRPTVRWREMWGSIFSIKADRPSWG